MAQISIIDYGMGNIHSVAKALAKVSPKNYNIKITKSISDLEKSDRIIFPGQGAAKQCMENLKNNFDIDKFKLIISQKPFLGICIGLQVLMTKSEEDNTTCLNIFDGSVKKISNTKKGDIKLPHMGWSPVQIKEQHPIFKDINNNSFFYFVHSFYVDPRNDNEKTSYTDYGLHFTSTINRDNYVAVQFHPEKSSTNGLILLKNFIDWSV